MNAKLKATTALVVSATGAALTLNSSSFIGELMNHALVAATIGGLADWFAVTALFRKPLGFISFRTEILKRNRERIMEAIVDFVSSDLLSPRNIIDNIKSESMSTLLVAYFEQNDGRDKVKILVNEILLEVATTVDTKSIARTVTPIIKAEAQKIDVAEIINTFVKILSSEKIAPRILENISTVLRELMRSAPIQEVLRQKIIALLKAYEADSPGRALVLNAMNLTDEKILNILNDKMDNKLQTLSVDDMTELLRIATSDDSFEKFTLEMKQVLGQKVDLAEYVRKWLDLNLKSETYLKNQKKLREVEANGPNIIKLDRVEPVWKKEVESILDEKIDIFIKSPVQQDKFDRFVKRLLEELINKYHNAIPDLIRDRLNSFSDEELTTFVEDRVSDDLQMIRINGSICGGLVGLILFLVTYGIKVVTG